MSKKNLIVGLLFFVVLLIVSEVLYVVKNRWVLYDHSLKATKMLNSIGRADIAFRVSTFGKYSLPNSDKYKLDVVENIKAISPTLNLPVLIYRFALSAYEDDFEYLTPQLLNLCIEMDPDFSFWRVELANYYLLKDDPSQAKTILYDCMNLPAPKAHCQDYFNSNYLTKDPREVGFLSESVINTYKIYPSL